MLVVVEGRRNNGSPAVAAEEDNIVRLEQDIFLLFGKLRFLKV